MSATPGHEWYMRELTQSLIGYAQGKPEVVLTSLIHYAPRLVEMGIIMDRLAAENEHLRKIVDLIDLKNERDALKLKVAELERRISEGGFIY